MPDEYMKRNGYNKQELKTTLDKAHEFMEEH